MDTATAKKNAHRLVLEGINKGNLALLEEVLAPDYVEHSAPPGLPPDREGFKTFIMGFRTAFPDLAYTIEAELADGDMVMHRLTGSGTMMGDFLGMKATGKKATWQEMHIGRVNDKGQIAEHWATVDQVSMLTQLGLMPAPAG